MELRRLHYFVTVAEERHISRAAARLGMAQPPLSRQIVALENEIGVKLFDRLHNGVALTPAGQALMEEAHAILGAASDSVSKVRRIAAGETGHIVAGMTTSAALHPIGARLMRSFREAHPGVNYQLQENNAAALTEAVLVGRIDLAIVRAPVARPLTLEFIELAQENMIAALPAGNDLPLREGSDGKAVIALADLADQGFILVRRSNESGLYSNAIEACRRCGFEPRIVAEVARMLINLNLVAAGVGISLVPESMRQVGWPGVVYADLEAPAAVRPLLLAPLTLIFRNAESKPAVRGFIEAARHLVAPE